MILKALGLDKISQVERKKNRVLRTDSRGTLIDQRRGEEQFPNRDVEHVVGEVEVPTDYGTKGLSHGGGI